MVQKVFGGIKLVALGHSSPLCGSLGRHTAGAEKLVSTRSPCPLRIIPCPEHVYFKGPVQAKGLYLLGPTFLLSRGTDAVCAFFKD